MGKIKKLREIGQILKWMRGWVMQDTHPFGGRDCSILHSHIVEAQQRVEELIAEKKKEERINYIPLFARDPRRCGDIWAERTEGKDEEKELDDRYSENIYDALRYDRYETGIGIADIRQFTKKRAEQSRNQEQPHFKRAEIVFEKFVPEGTSMKMYQLKKFINIATERELPIEYKGNRLHFYARENDEICLVYGGEEHCYSCTEHWESVLTEPEYWSFMEKIKKAGERLHKIMEQKRELANHKGEERRTI